MRNLTATLCLTLAITLAGVKLSASADDPEGFNKQRILKGISAYFSGDYTTAIRELTPLAEQQGGGLYSQFFLGDMYHHGKGVAQNYKTSMKWFRLASEQGHANAQLMLSGMYFFGQGVVKNYIHAHMWASVAVSNGNEAGVIMQGSTERNMSPSQIEKAKDLARECIRKKYKGC